MNLFAIFRGAFGPSARARALAVLLAPVLALAAEPVEDEAGRAFLEKGTEVVLACEPDYPPFVFNDPNGRPTGYAIDLFKLAAEKVGLRYRMQTGRTWDELLTMSRRGEVDVIPCLWLNEERRAYLRFIQPPYAEHTMGIVVRSDDRDAPTRNNLRGKVIAQVKNYAFNAKWREEHPDAVYLEVISPGEAIKLVAFGKADAYVDGVGTISHLCEKLGISNLRVSDEFTREGSAYHMAVSLRHPELEAILTEALGRVSPEEIKVPQERWLRVHPSLYSVLRPYLLPSLATVLTLGAIVAVLLAWNRRLSREIALRRCAEAESAQARHVAEEANRLKSEFLANMSHEIRTPMNAILGYAQLMHSDPRLPPEQLARVETINRAGEHLLALINDILEMSKIEAGRIVLNVAPMNLHALLDDILDLNRPRVRDKGLRLRLERDPHLPRNILCDESKLRQALINLVGNAVKFTATGGIRLEATASPAPEGGHLLRFAVSDTGPGIAPEEIAKLFRPFVQSSGGHQAGGTGLGLAISRRYARLLGGDITVDSTPGRGSTFVLTLRADDAPETATPGAAAIAPAGPVRLAPGHPAVRVLIADDLEVNRDLLGAMLEPVGFELRFAAEGAEALEIFREWKPHAVLMDMRMPGMDGYEANRRIKASPQGADTFIVAITASAFEEQKTAVLASGADVFMRKPFRKDALLALLGERLHLRYECATETRAARGPDALTPEAVAALPADLRATLEKACLAADFEALQSACEQIAATDAPLAGALRERLASFDYEAITRTLNDSRS